MTLSLKISVFGLLMTGLSGSLGCGSSDTGTGADEADAVELDPARSVTMNDISVLFPLTDPDKLLHADTVGAKGQLLPLEMYKEVPQSIGEIENSRYPRLRAVGVRFDPCAPKLLDDPKACFPTLRIVWQSVEPADGEERPVPEADDVTFHAGHLLTHAEWDALVQELVELKLATNKDYSKEPLTVHPAIAEEGLDGPYARGLKELVLKYAGQKNLVKLAFVALFARNDWVFGIFDNANGVLTRQPIPTLAPDTETQGVARPGVPGAPLMTYTPGSAATGILALLERPTSNPSVQYEAAFDTALRIENPTIHSIISVDCVSCHAANFLRSGAEPVLGSKSNPNRFTAEGNLTADHGPNSPSNFRMFGYFLETPTISQRTVNETAELVPFINRSLQGR